LFNVVTTTHQIGLGPSLANSRTPMVKAMILSCYIQIERLKNSIIKLNNRTYPAKYIKKAVVKLDNLTYKKLQPTANQQTQKRNKISHHAIK